jgi:hypothetical protein
MRKVLALMVFALLAAAPCYAQTYTVLAHRANPYVAPTLELMGSPAGGSPVGPQNADQVLVKVFDAVNGALKANAILAGGSTNPTPHDADQVFRAVYDPVNGAVRVNVVAGGGVSSTTVAGLPSPPTGSKVFLMTDGQSTTDCTSGHGSALALCGWNGSAWTSVGGGGGGGGGGVSSTTVAGLPSPPTGSKVFLVTDGQSTTDCTSGHGSALALCGWNGSAWTSVGGGGGGGGGGLSSFTVGNLSPLFTAALGANPTTAPALAFTLSNAAAYSLLANNTNGSAGPSYVPFATLFGSCTSALTFSSNAFGCNSTSFPGNAATASTIAGAAHGASTTTTGATAITMLASAAAAGNYLYAWHITNTAAGVACTGTGFIDAGVSITYQDPNDASALTEALGTVQLALNGNGTVGRVANAVGYLSVASGSAIIFNVAAPVLSGITCATSQPSYQVIWDLVPQA